MSTNPRIYLDFNASAPLRPEVREAIAEVLIDAGANPSSIHAEGRRARDLVERARNQVAALVGRPREEVVFTSGGTEANALGMATLAEEVARRGGRRVVASSALDHPSLRGAVAALGDGDRDTWRAHVLEHDHDRAEVGMVALSAVNHELGTMPDLAAIIGNARAAGALVHVDAVQAAGKLDLTSVDADTIAISAHKLGGPPGVGALITRIDPSAEDDVVERGHQERGRRAGTENVLGIVGFGAACAAVDLAAWERVKQLGDKLERGLVALGARINGADRPRVGGTINAAFPGIRGESIVIALDLAGIAASTGAACTSGSIKPSPVLLALGQTAEQAREAVRFSLGTPTTDEEIARVLAVLPGILERARGLARP